ncbi:MAG TPA: MFS transporter, partial [Nakamurella sp.]
MSHTAPVPGHQAGLVLTRRQIVAWRNAVFVIFGLSGVGMASWVSRTPSIRDALGASTFQMGLIVFGLAAGSIVGLTTSSHVLARIGSAATIRASVIVAGAGLAVTGVGATLATSELVVVGLAAFGLGVGLCDVSMNVEGAANERQLGRTVMPLFHALFSAGTILGAALGAAAELAGISIGVHLGVVGALMIVAVVVAVRYLQPDPAAEAAAADAAAANQAIVDAGGSTRSGWRSRLAIWRDRRTLL